MTTWGLIELPLNVDLETKKVLKALPTAHAALAELKGIASTIPNQNILINTLVLQEAKDSSAVESIITTHDELFKAELFASQYATPASKEVQSYADALKKGFTAVRKNNLLSNNTIIEIYQNIKHNTAGFRTTPGTTLKNDRTGEIVYQPPQSYDDIIGFMTNLEKFINDDSFCDIDPLVKMAIIKDLFKY